MDKFKKLMRIENASAKEYENIVPMNIQSNGLPDEKWTKQVWKLRLLRNVSLRLHSL